MMILVVVGVRLALFAPVQQSVDAHDSSYAKGAVACQPLPLFALVYVDAFILFCVINRPPSDLQSYDWQQTSI